MTTYSHSADTQAARSLAAVLRAMRAEIARQGLLPPPVRPFVCADCARDTHAASVVDPARCADCARRCYAWRPVPFGKVQKVPPREAARWE